MKLALRLPVLVAMHVICTLSVPSVASVMVSTGIPAESALRSHIVTILSMVCIQTAMLMIMVRFEVPAGFTLHISQFTSDDIVRGIHIPR